MIDEALWRKRSLVKTWSMRGALHLLPVDQFAIYVSALRRSGVREVQRWLSRKGISPQTLDTLTEAIVAALAPGALTRQELATAVANRLGEEARQWIEHSWGGVVKQAALQGLVCYGRNRGREITFVRSDQWLPPQPQIDEQEAQSVLLRNYLYAYGPARIQDFARWTGMYVKEAKAVLAAIEPDVSKET